MSYYDAFDCKSNCEDFNQVTEDEYHEVMQMMAEETEGFEHLPESNQQAWEREQDSLKDWTGTYSNIDTGATYNGIAI